MTSAGDRVAAIKAAYDACFGCGDANPLGLRLHGFTMDGDDSITARFVPRDDFRGFSGMLHGGIVAAALDETLAWTAMLRAGHYVLTGTLDLRYRRPAPVDGDYLMRGTVVDRRGRRLVLEGAMLLDGTVTANARGVFLAADPVPGSGAGPL